jgi:hypothetical protein
VKGVNAVKGQDELDQQDNRSKRGTRCFDLTAACATAQAIQEQFGQALLVVRIHSSGVARPTSGEPYDTYTIEVWRRSANREVCGKEYWVVGCVNDDQKYRSTWRRILTEACRAEGCPHP